MYYSLRGKLIHTEPGVAVIECAGVGYKCSTTFTTQRFLPKLGEEATLFTHLHVREDAMELFGFYTKNELSCYKLLTAINGVGPKAGLSILSELSFEQVAMAISAGDVKSITRAQGVGPKLAQRIILELKDKMNLFGNADEVEMSQVPQAAYGVGNIPQAVGALEVLGYSSAEVTPILTRLDSSQSVEQLISATLKELGKGK